MDTLQDNNVLIVTAFFVVCTGALAILRWWAMRRARIESVRTVAEQAVAAFREQVAVLRKERSVLEAHLNDYFNTFQEAGWPDLVQLLLNLGQAEVELYSILDEGRYDEASQLANLLLGRLPHEQAKTASKQFLTGSTLVGWRERAEAIMIKLVESLEDAAAETEEVGISRRRKRQSTYLALHEIRNLYLRDRQH
jgi:hypothetical protein